MTRQPEQGGTLMMLGPLDSLAMIKTIASCLRCLHWDGYAIYVGHPKRI
jgi:hypothetical protein